MISSMNLDTLVASLASHPSDGPTVDNTKLQNVLKCIFPRPFTRSVISTGLQHADDFVKHGTIRIVLESLKSLASLLLAIDNMVESTTKKQCDDSAEGRAYLYGLPGINIFAEVDECLSVSGISSPAADELGSQKWSHLKQLIQDEVRALLPEPQVLLKLLSSSDQKHSKQSGVSLKGAADLPVVGSKKLKLNDKSEDIDIIISGIDTEHSDGTPEELKADNSMQELDMEKDYKTVVAEIWGLDGTATSDEDELNDAENLFQSKLLDVFRFYLVSSQFIQKTIYSLQ